MHADGVICAGPEAGNDFFNFCILCASVPTFYVFSCAIGAHIHNGNADFVTNGMVTRRCRPVFGPSKKS
jgi:hypothetical protein